MWYSAAWSTCTLASFRQAVTHLLGAALAAQQQQPTDATAALSHPRVLALLRHWQIKQVPLAAARHGWLDLQNKTCCLVANFKRKADRLALCQLLTTGELPLIGAGHVGSVVMFAVPAEFGERAFDECFLQVLWHMRAGLACWACVGLRVGRLPHPDWLIR